MTKAKGYIAPAVLELGKAQTLTLGGIGCQVDDTKCEFFKEADGQ